MKAVILLSGGLDSSTLLHYIVQRLSITELNVMTYIYGQKHRREIKMAIWQCEQIKERIKERLCVDLRSLQVLTQGASSLTDSTIPVPKFESIPHDERDQPVTYVPNRNMIFLALAAAYAEGKGIQRIFYAAQNQDRYSYWDCSSNFLEQLNQTLSLNRKCKIKIEAPFITLRKVEVLKLGFELGVDYRHTWTCYQGKVLPCRLCPSCIERQQAFAEIGRQDPLG